MLHDRVRTVRISAPIYRILSERRRSKRESFGFALSFWSHDNSDYSDLSLWSGYHDNLDVLVFDVPVFSGLRFANVSPRTNWENCVTGRCCGWVLTCFCVQGGRFGKVPDSFFILDIPLFDFSCNMGVRAPLSDTHSLISKLHIYYSQNLVSISFGKNMLNEKITGEQASAQRPN